MISWYIFTSLRKKYNDIISILSDKQYGFLFSKPTAGELWLIVGFVVEALDKNGMSQTLALVITNHMIGFRRLNFFPVKNVMVPLAEYST